MPNFLQEIKKKIMNSMRLLVFSIISFFWVSPSYSDMIPNDSYIAGYATGILKRDFELDLSSLVVHNGVITLSVPQLSSKDRAQILKMLSEIPGVNSVKLQEADNQQRNAAVSSPPTEEGAPAGSARPFGSDSTVLPTGFLPAGHLFKPLLADPRWAHFSAAYRNYVGDNIDGNNNGAVSFGETIPFYRANLGQSTMQPGFSSVISSWIYPLWLSITGSLPYRCLNCHLKTAPKF